tara:strand:+ start:657 stop:1496 length:840 start_codon:yes stop_codon:yes gene_type:complete
MNIDLHIRTRIKQYFFKKFGIRILKEKHQEFFGKKFRLIGMKIKIDYETGWLIELAKNSEIIFDVGCNIGQSAVLLNAFTSIKSIFLFEPNPYALAICTENAILNGFSDKIKLFNYCISNECTKEKEFFTVLSGAAGSLDPSFARTAKNMNSSFKVGLITLDKIINKEKVIPDFVKVDVEGHEFEVLSGSNELVKLRKTKFLVEMHSSPTLSMSANCRNILDWANKHNYIVVYLKEMKIIEEPDCIGNRGRCHLLLAPDDFVINPELKAIKQGSFIPKT